MRYTQNDSITLTVVTALLCCSFAESDSGPLELLRFCRRDGAAVRVVIRHCVGVRGVCDGVPVAFDRHMNIVLRNVTEWYVPFRTLSNGGITESRSQRKKRKKKALNVKEVQSDEQSSGDVTLSTAVCGHVTQDAITRHLEQLFIRGDNIIMISRRS